MQEWLCPGSSIQQATKAKRKLYCGEHAVQNSSCLLLLLLPAEGI